MSQGAPPSDDPIRKRGLAALVVAVLVHLSLALFADRAALRVAMDDPVRLDIDIVMTAPLPDPVVEDISVVESEPPPNEVPTTPPKPAPEVKREPVTDDTPPEASPPLPAVTDDDVAEPSPAPVLVAEPSERPPAADSAVLPEGTPSSEDLLRRRPTGTMGKVLGSDPFATKLSDIEKALDFKAEGPMSDEKRAAANAKRFIQDEMSQDTVVLGLVDDYFRELKNRMETSWQPATKDLNDGGDSTSRMGFTRDLAVNTAAWGEVLELYKERAAQYGRGEKVTVDKKRVERMRELFRSKRGNLRFHAISEVILTQAPDGAMLTIEFPISSGHPGIDEGIKEAFVRAISVMPAPPPDRLHHGRTFKSHWRLRATWRMVPPTALLTGTAFDVSAKGVDVDMPFQIKLTTHVMLTNVDTKPARED
jgi:hypothetical protein